MTVLIGHIISAILQVIVFTLIPFIFFLFRKDKKVSFFKYIGFYKPTYKSVLFVLLTIIPFLIPSIGLAFVNDTVRQTVLSPDSVTGQLRALGLSTTTILILLVIAVFKTSLSEEILFRGFIAKQLIYRFGFAIGNFVQASIFGLIHVLLFSILAKTTIIPLIGIFVFSGFVGWAIGFIKERYANGSIVPGWIAHGLSNVVSYYVIAFVL